MAQNEFYKVGGTVSSGSPSYVIRQADRDLLQALKAGNFCYVLDSRQIGKSSLMVNTAARLREEGLAVVVLDLTGVGQTLSADQWYAGLLNQVATELQRAGLDLDDEIDDFWLAHGKVGPLQRWFDALREIVLMRWPGQLVFFIDEIDAVRSLAFSSDEFFAGIRECYNRRARDDELNRLTFCLLGVAAPSDLIRDERTTPFNIGQRIELKDFTAAEAAPLAQGLGREKELSHRLLSRILYWTGGHPYLTQSLCRAVAEDESITRAAGIDRKCQDLFLSRRAREKDDNLLFVARRLLSGEAHVAAILDLYSKIRASNARILARKLVPDQENHTLINHLRLAGITRVVEGYLWVRNRIYFRVFDREWISANVPDAEKRRLNAAYRRGFRRASVVASILLLLTFAGTWIYLDGWVLENKTYYKSFTERYDVPVGLGRLELWEVQQGRISYRLTTHGRYGPLLRMEAVNSSGRLNPENQVGNYLRYATEDTLREPACQWEFVFDDRHDIVYKRARDRFNHLVWAFNYTPPDEPPGDRAKSPAAGHPRKTKGHYTGPSGYPLPQRESNAEYVDITYNEHGLAEKIFYTDRTGRPMPGLDRAYGQMRSYDSQGRITRIVSLASDGKPVIDQAGNCILEMTYNNEGDLVQTRALDTKENPTPLKHGYCIDKEKRDRFGNLTEEAYFDESGSKAVHDSDGVARVTYRYENGHQIDTAYFDEVNQPTRQKDGYARWTARYDDFGNRIDTAYFDEKNQPVRNSSGYARSLASYDVNGNESSVRYFDEENKPVRQKDGYARWTAAYNDFGDETEVSYFDEEGKPIRCKKGYARWTSRYDNRGHQTAITYFDELGKMIRIKDGYAIRRALFDDFGNFTAEAYFDETNKPIRNNDGIARETACYDERGNRIEVDFLDELGKPVRGNKSVASWKALYDDRGNQTERDFFDESGKLVRSKDGYAGWTAQFDERGNEKESVFFDEKRNPVRAKNCVSVIKSRYDERGNIVEIAYFDESGRPVRHKDGYARVTWRYDKWGNQVEKTYADESGNPIACTELYAQEKWLYDDYGDQIEEAYFDESGKPVQCSEKYSRVTWRYNKRHNPIEKTYFDESGKPAMPGGYWRLVWSYDNRDNKVEESYFDTRGKPAVLEGYSCIKWSYDANDNQIEEDFFDGSGHPVTSTQGYARIASEYDSRGQRIKETYEDASGRPVKEFSGGTIRYDEYGHIIEIQYFDDRNELSGRMIRRYNERGNQIEEAYFNPSGKPATRTGGSARVVWRYDERDNKIGENNYGESGDPVNTGDGYSRVTWLYDLRDNNIETHYYDKSGHASSSWREGYAKVVSKFDERDRELEVRFFDEFGRPCKLAKGYAGYRVSYKGCARDGERHFFDENGNSVAVR